MVPSNVAEQHGIHTNIDIPPETEMSEHTTFLLCSPAVMQVAHHYLRLALDEARKSPPKPTNYCVGALLVRAATETLALTTLATGYTLECEGNTHAEQCCFIKLAAKVGCGVEELGDKMNGQIILYTTMEPCNQRSPGNMSCVDRILALKSADGTQAIKTVICGVREPADLVATNSGRARLEAAGIKWGYCPGMEDEILEVAKAGHVPPSQTSQENDAGPSRSNIHDLLN